MCQTTASAIRTAVIPVAGLGTRLLPLSRAIPKEMLPVGSLPAIHHIVTELIEWGIDRQILILQRRKMAIADYLEESSDLASQAHFAYVFQNELRGLGHAVLQAEEWVGEGSFLVALGDAVLTSRELLGRMVAAHRDRGTDGVIAFEEVPLEAVSRYGIAEVRGGGDVFELADLVEKPQPDEAPSVLAVSARYLLTPEIFGHLRSIPPGHGGEIQLTDAIRSLIKSGGKVLGVKLLPGERRYDIGSFETYSEAFVDLALQDESSGFTRWLRKRLSDQEDRI